MTPYYSPRIIAYIAFVCTRCRTPAGANRELQNEEQNKNKSNNNFRSVRWLRGISLITIRRAWQNERGERVRNTTGDSNAKDRATTTATTTASATETGGRAARTKTSPLRTPPARASRGPAAQKPNARLGRCYTLARQEARPGTRTGTLPFATTSKTNTRQRGVAAWRRPSLAPPRTRP